MPKRFILTIDDDGSVTIVSSEDMITPSSPQIGEVAYYIGANGIVGYGARGKVVNIEPTGLVAVEFDIPLANSRGLDCNGKAAPGCGFYFSKHGYATCFTRK